MIYEYKCTKCGKVNEEHRQVDDREAPGTCSMCGEVATKIFSTSNLNTGAGSRMGTICTSLPGDPVLVKNKYHFRELCKQHDLTPCNL